jgi:hypothetical protein
MNTKLVPIVVLSLMVILGGTGSSSAQASNRSAPLAAVGTAFTYQGRLIDGTLPASTAYDFQFYLFDALSGGSQVGSMIPFNDLLVADGYFTVVLDFGSSAFNGQARFLEVRLRLGSSAGAFTTLTPRQELTAAPYALYSLSAPWSGLVGVPASFADGVDNDTLYTPGTGLTLSSGQFSILAAYRLPQGCSYGEIPKWLGSGWNCMGDEDTKSFWSLNGNSGTNPATQYLGTDDGQPLEIRLNGERVLRLEPGFGSSPNIIGGYYTNWVGGSVDGATIFGGESGTSTSNRVTDSGGTVSGGVGNQAGNNAGTEQDALYATVGGGSGNTSSGQHSTVSGGIGNIASGQFASVTGGNGNGATASFSAVCGGQSNMASGANSAIVGGYGNIASGIRSFAIGYQAVASQNSAFVWSDDAGNLSYDPYSYPDAGGLADSFNVRATGGVYFVTSIDTSTGRPTNGMYATSGGSGWYAYSDRAGKRDIVPVDASDILTRLSALQVSTWSYKSQDASIRHIGPMAQDFNAAFGLGEPDKVGDKRYINSIDVDGVALAAIQGLYQQNQQLQAENADLRSRLNDLDARLSALEQGSAPPLAASNPQSLLGFGILGLAAVGVSAVGLAKKKAGEK